MKDKINNTPKLRKKNGTWKILAVGAVCTMIGAGAMTGLAYGIPAVGNLFINQSGQTTGQTSELQKQISKLTTELNNASNLAEQRLVKINELSLNLGELEVKKTSIEAELEQVKNDALLSDEEKQAQITNLETQMTELEINKTSLMAQLNQAQIDKSAAENLVSGLQLQIAELQARIDKLEGNAIVDTLKIENFEGTWYKNGTFEDYFTIESGKITRGANIDAGVVYKLYNQVYLGLKSLNNTACALSENGTKITLEDGTEYTKSFINTIVEAPVNIGTVVGEYTFNNQIITLNDDNTCSYVDGVNKNYGAFTVSSTRQNLGGNITIIHNLTMTINNNNEQQKMELELINNKLLYNDNYFIKTNSFNEETIVNMAESYKTDCYKIVVKLKNKKVLEKGNQIGISISNASGFYVNGQSYYSPGGGAQTYFRLSNSGETKSIDYLTLYIKATTNPINVKFKINIADVNTNIMSFLHFEYDIVSAEKIGTPQYKITFMDYISDFMHETFYKSCNPIADYFTGTIANDQYIFNIANNTSATITAATDGATSIQASSMIVTAETDGTNIVHHITVKFGSDDTEKTITFDLLNNSKEITNFLISPAV